VKIAAFEPKTGVRLKPDPRIRERDQLGMGNYVTDASQHVNRIDDALPPT
jgi:hypothetical protein